MTIYWISFRIADETIGGKSYDERYEALNAAISGRATRWWVQTTSFAVIESTPDIDAHARAFKQAIAPSADLFVMRAMDTKNAVICGNNQDSDIHDFMPYLKKL